MPVWEHIAAVSDEERAELLPDPVLVAQLAHAGLSERWLHIEPALEDGQPGDEQPRTVLHGYDRLDADGNIVERWTLTRHTRALDSHIWWTHEPMGWVRVEKTRVSTCSMLPGNDGPCITLYDSHGRPVQDHEQLYVYDHDGADKTRLARPTRDRDVVGPAPPERHANSHLWVSDPHTDGLERSVVIRRDERLDGADHQTPSTTLQVTDYVTARVRHTGGWTDYWPGSPSGTRASVTCLVQGGVHTKAYQDDDGDGEWDAPAVEQTRMFEPGVPIDDAAVDAHGRPTRQDVSADSPEISDYDVAPRSAVYFTWQHPT